MLFGKESYHPDVRRELEGGGKARHVVDDLQDFKKLW